MNKQQSPTEQNEVDFGARGFLLTLAGLIIGAAVGFILAVLLSHRLLSGPAYGDSVSLVKVLTFWKIIGGVGGATLGAFIGILIGTTRRED